MPYRRTCDECGDGYEYETRPKGGECYCSDKCLARAEMKRGPGTHDRYGNKLEPLKLDIKTIKRKAKKLKNKIEALKLEALIVAVYLEDNGQGIASAHFLSIGDGLLKASEAAELIS